MGCSFLVAANFTNSSGFFNSVKPSKNTAAPFATANDNCATATSITSFPYTNNQSDGASAAADGFVTTCEDDEMNDGLWYKVQGNGDNIQVTIIPNDNYDPQLGIYSGECDELACEGTIDNSGSGGEETLLISNSAVGTTYYINIGHYSSSTDIDENSFVIEVISFGVPANDNCAGATEITSMPYTNHQTDAAGASPDGFLTVCDDDEMNDGVWYSVEGDGTDIQVTVTPDSQDYDFQLAVFSGDCSVLTCEGTVDNSGSGEEETLLIANSVAGTIYYINIGHYSDEDDELESNFTITVSPPPTVPVNDNCAGAIEITTIPYSNNQIDAVAATEDGFVTTCNDEMNDGVWYSVEGDGSNIEITVSPSSSYDPQLGIFTGTCDSFTCVGTVDDGGSGGEETFSIRNSAVGTIYYINIGHYSSSDDEPEKNFTIDVISTPALDVPANDNCTGATAITSMPYNNNQTDGAGATSDGFVTACTNSEMNDGLWYSVAGNGNNIEISVTPAGDYDIAIGVFTGTCDAFECVETVDDAGEGNEENITIPRSEVGVTYYINVGYYSGYDDEEENSFVIDVISTVPPDFAECSAAIFPLDGATDVPVGDVDFTWDIPATGGEIDSYNLYGGTTTPLTDDDFIGNYDTNTANLTITGYNSLFYWKVVPLNSGGEAIGCDEWTFTTLLPPPVPDNDTCETATDITSFPYNETLDASSATNNDGFILTCSSGMNDGIWYTVTGNGSDIVINATSENWDAELAVYTGSCGSFICYDFADNGVSGDTESITIEDSEVGARYFINFGHYSDSSDSDEGPSTIEILSNGLSVGDNQFKNFVAYPNPVKDFLNLSHTETISSVEIFNLVGQKMITKSLDATQSQIDMSNLSSGTYFVKVTSGQATKTIKVLKQ